VWRGDTRLQLSRTAVPVGLSGFPRSRANAASEVAPAPAGAARQSTGRDLPE